MKHRKSTAKRTIGAVAALAAVGGGVVTLMPSAEAAGCPDVAVFETDGYGNGQSLNNWNRSGFNHNPPAGWEIVKVPYNDGVFPVVDKLPLDKAVADGKAKLKKAVLDFHANCSNTPMKLAGYSEGAVVAGDVLADFATTSEVPHHLLSGTLYGDPRRQFGEGGIGGVAGGIETNLPTILEGVTMKGGRDFKDIAVREVCNENDGICNSTNMITNAMAFANGLVGYAQGDHGYDLNPARDTGKGLTFHKQPHKINFGAPLPLPVGTPWQIQNQLGGADALPKVIDAEKIVKSVVGADTLNTLKGLPWFQLLQAA